MSLSKLSQAKKVVEFLKANSNQKFNARQIAESIVNEYPDDYLEKRQNPRFENEKTFISQIVAEIGSQKDQITKVDKHVFWQDKPRPRIYWYNPDKSIRDIVQVEIDEYEKNDVEIETSSIITKSLSEHELYPILINYLKSELKLYCQRIDEKRSKILVV